MDKKICVSCSTIFMPTSNNQRYCYKCKKARNKNAELNRKNNMIPNCKCDNCSKKYYIKPHQLQRSKTHFCCTQCHDEYRKNNIYKTFSSKVKMDFKEWLKEKYINELKTSREIAAILYGNTNNYTSVLRFLNEYKIELRHGSEAIKVGWKAERKELSKKIAIKYLQTKENRDKLRKIMKSKEYKLKSRNAKLGIKNPMYGKRGSETSKWNPDLTDEERIKNRNTEENEIWRNNIYKKYNYTCAICGDNKGGNLNAHHLNAYAAFPNERFDANNGICLCETCHIRFHNKYGYGNNTKEQFKEWEKSFID